MVNYDILMKILNMDEPLKSHKEAFPTEEMAKFLSNKRLLSVPSACIQ